MHAYTQVCDFLKDTVSTDVVLRGLEARKNRAAEVRTGLEGLVQLLSPSQDMMLRHDALAVVASAQVRVVLPLD